MAVEKLDKIAKKNMRDIYLQYDFPKVYGISIGRYKCTRKCKMCPMYNEIPDFVQITDDIMIKALEPIQDRNVDLEITAYGEPFTHPKCDDYMFLSRKMAPKAKIMFVSNGSVINEERANKIVDSGIDCFQFSLDSGSKETYKWLTGSNAYEDVCRKLEKLAEIKEKKNAKHLRIQTHILGLKEQEHEFDEFVKKWSKIVDEAQVREYGNWGGRVDDNGVTPANNNSEIPKERYPCAWLWYCTKIEPEGNVIKCHQHSVGDEENPEILGNILENSFEDIWKGENMRLAREAHLTNNYDKLAFCKDCQVWSCFYDVWNKEKKLGIFPTGNWA